LAASRLLAGERILLTLWVGGLWAIGYIVTPALFATLDDRALAGSLAGVMFEAIAFIGLFCGTLLLAGNRFHAPGRWLDGRSLLLFSMLILVLIGQFVLSPMIADLREAGKVETAAFARMHGLAAILYLLNSLLGLVLVVKSR